MAPLAADHVWPGGPALEIHYKHPREMPLLEYPNRLVFQKLSPCCEAQKMRPFFSLGRGAKLNVIKFDSRSPNLWVFVASVALPPPAAHGGVVLNPSYKRMALYGSEYWTYSLVKRATKAVALRLTDSVDPISAYKAERLGLVDKVLDRALYTHTTKGQCNIPPSLSYGMTRSPPLHNSSHAQAPKGVLRAGGGKKIWKYISCVS